MNINLLLDLLIVKQGTESYDAISDFKQLVDSPDLSKHVENTINDEILSKAKIIINNKGSTINVEVGKSSIIIKKDDQIVYGSDKEWYIHDLYRIICLKLIEFREEGNIIYSFRTIGDFEERTIKKIYEEFENIKREITNGILVCKIDKDNILKEKSKFDGYFCKFFLKDEDNYYFVYFRIKKKYCDNYTDDPVLYFLVNRIQDEKIDKKNIKNVDEYSKEEQNIYSCDLTKYVLYIMRVTVENINIDSFFDVNFERYESYYFIRFLMSLRIEDNFNDVIKSYLETLPEDKVNEFLFAYKHYSLMDNEMSSKVHLSYKKYKREQEVVYYLKSLLPSKYKDIEIKDYILSPLRLFFIYQLRNNRDLIMERQEYFMKTMNWEIYNVLKHIYEGFEKKILKILRIYNEKLFKEVKSLYHAEKLGETTREALSN